MNTLRTGVHGTTQRDLVTLLVTGAVLKLAIISGTASAGLLQSFQQTGNLGLEIDAAAAGNPPAGTPATGSLTLGNFLPGQAVQAMFYANTVNNSGNGLDLTLNSLPPIVSTVGPFASDNSGILTTMYAYRWDVTSLVNATGAGMYNFSVGQNGNGNQLAGVALAVVYNDPSASTTQVTIVDGIQSVAENGVAETESTTLTNLLAGPTQLSIFTVMDDNAGTGEQIKYNNNLIGTNIDQGLGFNASLLQFNTTSVAGNNVVDLVSSTGVLPQSVDNFGWMLATTAVTVPEPGAVCLAGFGAVLLLALRYRDGMTSKRSIGRMLGS